MSSRMLHTCVRVKDLETSIKFYKEALGFEEMRRRDFPDYQFTLVYLSLPGDDYELELTYNYGHEAYDLGNGYGHIALSVPDLLEEHARHTAAGYEVTKPQGLPGTPPGYYFIIDPDGYKIELIQANSGLDK